MTLQGTSNNSGITMGQENVLPTMVLFCNTGIYIFGAFILLFDSRYNANQITMNINLIPVITNNSI